MSEYEASTFFAVMVLAEEFAKIADATNLIAQLRGLRDSSLLDGCTNAAANYRMLLDAIVRVSKSAPEHV
jgi:hypothetical protein